MRFCCPNLTCIAGTIVGCSDHVRRFAIFGMSNVTPRKYQKKKNNSGFRPSRPTQKCCLQESYISISLRDPTFAMQAAPSDLGGALRAVRALQLFGRLAVLETHALRY